MGADAKAGCGAGVVKPLPYVGGWALNGLS